jgi:predicted ATPase
MKTDPERKKRSVVIRTPDHHLRVFVSSTLNELAAEREAVYKAITRLRLAPIMFESGARAHPAKDLYQAYISQSHIFIGIYWQSYGWTGPGMQISGLEDEYNRSKNLPRLIYIKKPASEREQALKLLLERVREENASSYKYFSSAEELSNLVENDLILLLTEYFETARAGEHAEEDLSATSLTNVPIPRNPLIGREVELETARNLLLREDIALVTLTGPAGTGKSRLGIQMALELRDRFSDGSYMVGLESIRDPGLVIPTIAKTLKVTEGSGELSILELLKRHLCDKQMLLLLDNFEQILPAAPLVADLLEACPKVKILVTSRASLHLRAEKELPIPPLSVPPLTKWPELEPLSQYSAVQLFIQRCQAVKSDFQVTNENAPAVAEICQRLDGLPLAIELAAARIKLLTPQALLGRLERRFDVLRGGTKDLPERQQTMYSAIDWSYSLLNEPEKQFFRRLSVFSGGWIVEAAVAVCGADGQNDVEILDLLEMLVDNNLIRPPEEALGEPRLRMLESIREFASDRLNESGECEVIHQRHAQYFASLAEQAEREKYGLEQQLAWRMRLEAELANMRAAMSWALKKTQYACELRIATGLWRFWWTHGYLREGIQWLQQGLARLEPNPSDVRARALTRLGWMLNKVGDAPNGLANLQEAVNLWRQNGNQSGLAQALSNLGGIMLPHDVAQASALLEEALAIRQELSDKHGVHATLMNLGLAMYWQGNTERMIELFSESLRMAQDLKDNYSKAITLLNLGDAYIYRGEYQRAEDCFAEAEEVYKNLGDRAGLAEISRSRGSIALRMGDNILALNLFTEALRVASDTDIMSLTLVSLEGIAFVAQKTNDPIKALHLLSACETLRQKLKLVRIASHQAEYETYLFNLRRSLKNGAYEEAWDDGSKFTLDQAVDYAMASSE